MAKVIQKYEMAIADETALTLPEGAEILSCQTQRWAPDVPVLWILHEVPTDKTMLKSRTIRMVGTDIPMEDMNLTRHIGTIQIRGGRYALHVFEQV